MSTLQEKANASGNPILILRFEMALGEFVQAIATSGILPDDLDAFALATLCNQIQSDGGLRTRVAKLLLGKAIDKGEIVLTFDNKGDPEATDASIQASTSSSMSDWRFYARLLGLA